MTLIEKDETKDNNDLVTVGEVALLLRVADSTIRRWIKSGVLKAVELPSTNPDRQSFRIHRSVVNTILEGTTDGTAE